MIVKDLILKLQSFDQNASVVFKEECNFEDRFANGIDSIEKDPNSEMILIHAMTPIDYPE